MTQDPNESLPETSENHSALIGNAVVVRITKVKKIGGNNYKYASIVTDHGGGPCQARSKNRGLIITTITIGILQQAYSPNLVLSTFRVTDHLDDIQPAIGIEGHGNGIQIA